MIFSFDKVLTNIINNVLKGVCFITYKIGNSELIRDRTRHDTLLVPVSSLLKKPLK